MSLGSQIFRDSPAEPFEPIEIAYGPWKAEIRRDVGGMISSLSHAGKPVFLSADLDGWNPSHQISGGMPLMFPNAGSLHNGYCAQLKSEIGHHGFAMVKEWKVKHRSTSEVALQLECDGQTLEIYPVHYCLEHRYQLSERGLRVELHMTNHDGMLMPVAPGWHPYFACPENQKTGLVTSLGGQVQGQLSNDAVFDFGIVPPPESRLDFQIPGGMSLRMSFSSAIKHLQFWSEPCRPFICIEPFLGPPNTLNTAGCIQVPPGESRMLWMTIEVH